MYTFSQLDHGVLSVAAGTSDETFPASLREAYNRIMPDFADRLSGILASLHEAGLIDVHLKVTDAGRAALADPHGVLFDGTTPTS